MYLREKEEQAVSLIKERYPHIISTSEAVRAAVFYLAFDESPVKDMSVEVEWITVDEAAKILTDNSEDHHTITANHVYKLARTGRIRTNRIPGKGRGGMQVRFNAVDCHNYHIKQSKYYPSPSAQAES